MIHDFTKRKFTNLPKEQQHKKCAELLRDLYNISLENGLSTQSIDLYQSLCTWMELPKMEEITLQQIADRYHSHAKCADIQHKEHNLLPNIRQGDRPEALPSWDIAIYLDNIRSAHNVGSIIRTVEAFSLGKVYFTDNTPYADHKQVRDAAMGADRWIQCYQGIPLKDLPKPLIAMETASTAIPIAEYSFPDTFTLAIGNEEYGCSKETLQAADAIVEIPLRGRKNSLNVANAFAIAAAEIYRQRKENGHGL